MSHPLNDMNVVKETRKTVGECLCLRDEVLFTSLMEGAVPDARFIHTQEMRSRRAKNKEVPHAVSHHRVTIIRIHVHGA